ncbi:MAG TPA: MATE family efflux transporter [Bacillota bacterium]|nr:MATE family efflux transporter [Bacillota bacterium]
MTGLKTPIPDDLPAKEISAKVIQIAWPALVESFLIQLVSMVSTMMVGGVGTWAIAAIGYCTQPRFLILAIFQAFNTGSTALIARAKGAGHDDDANIIMHQSLLLSFGASLVMGGLGFIFATPMVIFMGANEPQTIAAATTYMRVLMLTFPANAITLAVTACLRGIGRTKISMTYNIVANLVNVAVGYVFINGHFGMPALGIMGAALGMAAGQIVSLIIALYALIVGSEMLRLRFKMLFQIVPRILKAVLNIGSPAMLEQLFMRSGQIMFSIVVASLGTDAFATHTIANNIFSMSMMIGQSFGISATSLIGQSLGKKRPDQGKAYVQKCRSYSMLVSMGLAAAFFLFGKNLVGLYSTEAAVIAQGAILLRIVAVIQPLQSSQMVLSGALRGAGDTKAVALSAFIGIVIVRPIISYIMVFIIGAGLNGVWLSIVFDQCIRSAYTMWRFSSDRWQNVKVNM